MKPIGLPRCWNLVFFLQQCYHFCFSANGNFFKTAQVTFFICSTWIWRSTVTAHVTSQTLILWTTMFIIPRLSTSSIYRRWFWSKSAVPAVFQYVWESRVEVSERLSVTFMLWLILFSRWHLRNHMSANESGLMSSHIISWVHLWGMCMCFLHRPNIHLLTSL